MKISTFNILAIGRLLWETLYIILFKNININFRGTHQTVIQAFYLGEKNENMLVGAKVESSAPIEAW